MPDPLSAFIDDIDDLERLEQCLDLSAFSKSGMVLRLYYREPDARGVYLAGVTASDLLARFPHWPVQLALDVANVSVLHVRQEAQGVPSSVPAGSGINGYINSDIDPALFYAKMANNQKNPRLWTWLLREVRQMFPFLFGEGVTPDMVQAVAKELGIDTKEKLSDADQARINQTLLKKIVAGKPICAADGGESTP